VSIYYNDFDKNACQWIKNLISAGHLPPGDVDDRSILDVRPDDLRGYTQVHFFAGLGGWPYALKLAGWDEARPVWTGSCPCQPFSNAGRKAGFDDERHLWPAFRGLIDECSPPVVFGEQVASRLGREWLSGVRVDLEAMGYACGAADISSAVVGAPHSRQRLWWVAHACGNRRARLEKQVDSGHGEAVHARPPADARDGVEVQRQARDPWGDYDFVAGLDGRLRRIEPGTFPVADGVPGRVGKLRAYGNAIVPQVAQAWIEAYMSSAAEMEEIHS
jgi:DNA (cytosine-5)-methyltransferase 1